MSVIDRIAGITSQPEPARPTGRREPQQGWELYAYYDAREWARSHDWQPPGCEWETWARDYEMYAMTQAEYVPAAPGEPPTPLTRKQSEVRDQACIGLTLAARDFLRRGGDTLHPQYQ